MLQVEAEVDALGPQIDVVDLTQVTLPMCAPRATSTATDATYAFDAISPAVIGAPLLENASPCRVRPFVHRGIEALPNFFRIGESGWLIRTLIKGMELEVHPHRRAQFVLPLRGVVRCEADQGVWIVPPRCAVWIPAIFPTA
jgi:hypothetical protein